MKIYILFSFIIFISCNEKNEIQIESNISNDSIKTNDFYSKLYDDKEYMDSLYNKIEKEGDTLAYNSANSISSLSGHFGELYLYQQIMAVKYKYPKAYFDMFNYMHLSDNADLRKLSVYYLLKACEMGNKRAIYYRDMFFLDKNKIPTAEEYFIEKDSTKFVHLEKMY